MQIPLKIAPGNLKRTGTPRINWQHPLSRDLKFCAIFENNSVPVELVTGTIGVPSGGPSPRASADGLGVGVASALSQSYSFAHNPLWNILGDLTVVWRGIFDTVSSAGFMGGKVTNNGSTATPWGMNVGNDASGAFDLNRANTTFRVWSSHAGLTTGTLYTLGATQGTDVSVAPSMYLNGLVQGTPTNAFAGSASGAATGNTLPVVVGVRPDAASKLNGQVSLLMAWSRQLTAIDHMMMYLAPYDFLIWPQDDLFAELVGIVGGATSLTLSTIAWAWNKPAFTLASTNVMSSKTWSWTSQPAPLQFANALTTKAWNWAKQSIVANTVNVLTSKVWNWANQPITLIGGATVLTLATATWNWANQAIIATGGGIAAGGIAAKEWIIRRRRRS